MCLISGLSALITGTSLSLCPWNEMSSLEQNTEHGWTTKATASRSYLCHVGSGNLGLSSQLLWVNLHLIWRLRRKFPATTSCAAWMTDSARSVRSICAMRRHPTSTRGAAAVTNRCTPEDCSRYNLSMRASLDTKTTHVSYHLLRSINSMLLGVAFWPWEGYIGP